MLQMFVFGSQRHGQLTVLPVVAAHEVHLPYLTLEEAVTSGILSVQEKTGESGILLAFNRSSRTVLVLNGEQPAGCRHPFVTSQSILLAPEDVTKLPVSPMRPSPPGAPGSPSGPAPGPGSGDLPGPGRHGDAVEAPDSAPGPGWRSAFPLVERQVGLMAFVGPRFLGLDVLGGENLLQSLHTRILEGYVMAARTHFGVPRTHAPPGEREASGVLALLQRAERTHCSPAGLGEYAVFGGPVRGGELLHDDQLVHLSVLPVPDRRPAGTRPH